MKSLRLYPGDVGHVINFLKAQSEEEVVVRAGAAEFDGPEDIPDLTQSQLDRLTLSTVSPLMVVRLHRVKPIIIYSPSDPAAVKLMEQTAGMLERDYRSALAGFKSPKIPLLVALVIVVVFVVLAAYLAPIERQTRYLLYGVGTALFMFAFMWSLTFGRSVKVLPYSRAEGRAKRQTILIAFGSAIAASVITIVLMGVFKIY